VGVGEVLVWLLFAALLFPAGLVGWAIGHDTSSHPRTKTVTVTTKAATAAPAPPTSTASGTTTATAAPTTTAAAAPSAAAGKAVFVASGCAACHTFKAAGATGKVGPDLDTAPAADAKKAGMSLDAFIKQSITDPNAFIAPGFQKGIMPSTFASLPPAKLAALVSFIAGGK
jgi:cytochrome c551/c552